MLDRFKTVGMLFAFWGASTGTASAFTPPYNTLIHSAITQQDGVCKGVVKDNQGETVIGASVVVKGSTNGTITGLDGDFTLNNVKRGDVIQISYIGYVSQEVVWQGTPLERGFPDVGRSRGGRLRLAEKSQPDRFGFAGQDGRCAGRTSCNQCQECPAGFYARPDGKWWCITG